jgi:hypothetical protein
MRKTILWACAFAIACAPGGDGGADGGSDGGSDGGGGAVEPLTFTDPQAWVAGSVISAAFPKELWLKAVAHFSGQVIVVTAIDVTGPVQVEGAGTSTETRSFDFPFPKDLVAENYGVAQLEANAGEFWQASGAYAFLVKYDTYDTSQTKTGSATVTVNAAAGADIWPGEDVFQLVSSAREGGGVKVNLKALAEADVSIGAILYSESKAFLKIATHDTVRSVNDTFSLVFGNLTLDANTQLGLALQGARADGRQYFQFESFTVP